MASMEQEPISAKRSSLTLGESLLVKEGIVGKVQMIYVASAYVQMHSTVSFPLEPGQLQRIAAKVIHFRGNEVVRIVHLQIKPEQARAVAYHA